MLVYHQQNSWNANVMLKFTINYATTFTTAAATSDTKAGLSAPERLGDTMLLSNRSSLTDSVTRSSMSEVIGRLTGLYLCLTCLLLPADYIAEANDRSAAPRR